MRRPRWLLPAASFVLVLLALEFYPSSPAHATRQSAGAPVAAAVNLLSGCTVCDLAVASVGVSCAPDGSVQWTARITNNRAGCSLAAGYTVNLQAHQPN